MGVRWPSNKPLAAGDQKIGWTTALPAEPVYTKFKTRCTLAYAPPGPKNPMICRTTFVFFVATLLVLVASINDSHAQLVERFNRSPLRSKPYAALPLGEVKAEGWLKRELQTMAAGMSGKLDSLYPTVLSDRNGWLGGDGDGWERGPYWIDGLLPLGHLLEDDALIAKANRWVEWTLENQADDGYLGPVPFAMEPPAEPGIQKTPRRDWWPKMVMLKVLQNHYSATRDPRVLQVLDRYFRYQLQQLPSTPLDHWTFWGSHRGGDNLAVVLWLYNETGEPYLLQLAEIIHRQCYDQTQRWMQEDSPLRRREAQHCVNIAQGMKHPVVYSQIDGKAIHLEAVKRGLSDLDTYFGHPTGLFGGDELLNSKRATSGSEFCTAAEMMLSLEMIAEITGDVEVLDRLERIAFNVLPSHVLDDYSAKQYYSTVNQVDLSRRTRRAHVNDHDGTDTVYGLLSGYPCCLTNFHQAWPKFTQQLWLASRDGGVAALTYAPCRVTTEIDGQPVTITESTCYPFEDIVRMKVELKSPQSFPMHLRIPHWCQGAKVMVNGSEVASPTSGTIYKVEHRWSDGDIVELKLPCQIELSRWYQASVSVHRGPLLYALKMGESVEKVEGTDAYGDYTQVHPTTPWNYGLPVTSLEDPDAFTFEAAALPIPENPWTAANAPVQIRTLGHRIDQWKLTDNKIAGELSRSPVKIQQLSTETITLIPYGCTMLRIAEFPLVSTAPDANPWVSSDPVMLYAAAASYCHSNDSIDAIADSLEPSTSDDTSIPRLTFWDHRGTREWCEATFSEVRMLDETSVYWFDDRDLGGQCRVPQRWRIYQRTGGQWVPVEVQDSGGTERNQFNRVAFKRPIHTDAIRIEIDLQEKFSAGILEWRIYKSSR